jgi:hypothetical protein
MRLVSLLNTTVLLSLASAVVLAALFIYLFIYLFFAGISTNLTRPGLKGNKLSQCFA